MEKTLGLDLGTNSIGWAIVEREGCECRLVKQGVHIFKDGVAHDQSGEHPMVQTRTEARAARRHYFRRRLRKIELLKVLIANDFCPYLSDEQLSEWKLRKKYPLDDRFMMWQRTDDNSDRNPYHDRFVCLTEKLNLSTEHDRHTLGRALYHLAQRRGFLSNRKSGDSDEEGKVKSAISSLSKEMEATGCHYMGEYFYKLYQEGKKIRNQYTHRNDHCRAEFDAICRKQNLPSDVVKSLERAVFYQRPLKSQKGLVGRCTFEPSKSRCPLSHPSFEEFRMLSFINNIRIKTPLDYEPRPLTSEEYREIEPLFFRKSKANFNFEEIAKKIAGKKTPVCKLGEGAAPYQFNYRMDTSVSGCPVTASLMSVFGDDWQNEISGLYVRASGKTREQIIQDVWHVLWSYDDDDRLKSWAMDNLQLPEDKADDFVKIHLPQGYASISLKAIRKILEYLRCGYRYDQAVCVANVDEALPESLWQEKHDAIVDAVTSVVDDPDNVYGQKVTIPDRIVVALSRMGIDSDEIKKNRLYHPSMIETYRAAMPNEDGVFQLGSPRTAAVRNPMAMRALFRLRQLLNKLLKDGDIDPSTKINIEFARELNDSNLRKAIQSVQRENENDRKKCAAEIKKVMGENYVPSEDEILKYQLWEEQKHICLYTGKQINIAGFIGPDSAFDIEHTVPRSRGGDDAKVNKTLCDSRFNREIKRGKLPSELSESDAILERIETLGWKEKIDELHKQIEYRIFQSKNAQTKDAKDRAIQGRHSLRIKLNYLEEKLRRFTMKEIPEGFTNRQGVDIGIIGRYARLYIQTVFNRVYTIKGATTADFRKGWGLQREYEKKSRDSHAHHCIDAITIACIGSREYAQWAHDRNMWDVEGNPVFDKPWPTFTEDVLAVGDGLLVPHYNPDNIQKVGRKKVRVRGKIKVNPKTGDPLYAVGKAARGPLHLQTYYGAIMRDDQIRYVVRKPLDSLKEGDIKNIVDDSVREKIQQAIADRGGLKNVFASPVWMNEEKQIPINRVRIFTPSVTRPIDLKKQRDLSVKDYKQQYHVSNDSNYCMAIYEGKDAKGKTKRTFKLVSNLDAAKNVRTGMIPSHDKNGYPLLYKLTIGTMVLFYQDSPEEIKECSSEELSARLYMVSGMSSMLANGGKDEYGTIVFKHHLEARTTSELNIKKGAWRINEEFRPLIGQLHGQIKTLVENKDFELSLTGEVILK